MVEVEGFSSKNSFPLGDGDAPRGSRRDFDLVSAPWDVLEVNSQALTGFDATRGQGEERSIVGFVPREVDSGEFPLLPGTVGII